MDKLEDALEKTGHDFKLLICNDGSSDRTSEILTEYSERLPIEVINHSINQAWENMRIFLKVLSRLVKKETS